ncbi:PH domain-containing protein [Streptomyces milbemycinicus]|uniref:PH domain-containing protein n=1 Tax=Streptomyces milbemycinicus TaxID=476552 RepID=UPI003F4CD00B
MTTQHHGNHLMGADHPAADSPGAGWRSLDPRTIAVHCSWMAAPLGSLALTALATGGRLGNRAWITLAVVAASFAVVTIAGLIGWSRTRYRVTADFLELRSGLFTRRQRAIPLHRVRNVDLTANPVQRLFGLVVLRAGTTGANGGRDGLTLEALTRPAAERLRAELLARAGTGDAAAEPVLSTGDPRWLRYAPFTFWVFGGVFAVVGAVWRVLDGIGVEPWRIGPVRHAFEDFGNSVLWVTIPLALLAVAAVGGVGAVAVYAENWWGYRLEWADAGTLQVRRGLLTTRSVSIERARLRGAVLREPMLLRAAGGAAVRAVASGLGNREENRTRSAVLPPAPRAEALRVLTGMLARPGARSVSYARSASPVQPVSPTRPAHAPIGEALFDRPELTRHPRAALRRRVMRGMVWVVAPVTAVLAVLGVLLTPVLLYCAGGFLLVATPVVYALARDAYRALGHGLAGGHDGYLLIRSGTFSRDTVALNRRAVLAWTFTDSPLSRRAGVTTVTAAVAAGEDGYRIPDMAAGEAAGFADAAAPGILDEFLVTSSL